MALVVVAFIWWKLDKELGIHFFSEAIELLIASAVVDRLLEWDRDARTLPARLAAIADASELAVRANELLINASRSVLPAAELDRVRAEKEPLPELWVTDYMDRLNGSDASPYLIDIGPGLNWRPWSEMLFLARQQLLLSINQWLMRHTTHAPPDLTAVVHGLEENGLFRSLGYVGSDRLFWAEGNKSLRPPMFRGYAEKLRLLDEVVRRLSTGDDRGRAAFDWLQIESDLDQNPVRSAKAPWRPSAPPA